LLKFSQISFFEDPLQKCLELAAKDPHRPYLFVGASDDEVEAFIAAAAELQFTQPAKGEVCNGITCSSKRAHMAHLLPDGRNVAITGGVFNFIDDAMLKAIWYNGYTLLSHADSIYWSDPIRKYNPANIDEAIRRKQLIPVAQDTFLLSSAHRASYVLGMAGIDEITYNDRLLTKLTAGNRSAMCWTLQPQIMNAFQSAHIFHCMPIASPLAAYLSVFGVQSSVEECGGERNKNLASLLNIVQDEKYNEKGADPSAYSTRWYEQKKTVDEVFKDMRNVLIHTQSGGERSSLLAYSMPKEVLSAIHSEKLRSVFRDRGFPAIPGSSCNVYSTASVLCYCTNTYFPSSCISYFRSNKVAFDQDAYALHHMLRWISRSAVCNGEPVTVYVPSKRMRGLLENWMEEQGV